MTKKPPGNSKGICSLQLLTWTASFFALIFAITNSLLG